MHERGRSASGARTRGAEESNVPGKDFVCLLIFLLRSVRQKVFVFHCIFGFVCS